MSNTEDLKTKLEQIPNNVSGDGRNFIAQLKRFLKGFRDDTSEKFDSIGEGAVEQVFGLRLTEEHDYDNKGNPINNIFVEFDNTNVTDYLNAQIWMREENENVFHLVGTTSIVTYTITDVKAGNTYYVKVVACNKKAGTSDFVNAPTEDIEIRGSVLIPSAPTQFFLTWDANGPLWEWQFVDNGYIDYFELRMDQHPGTWNEYLLDCTRNANSDVKPPARSGTAYLYIRNIYGMYSQPATHTFNVAAPAKPGDPTLEMTLDGVVISMDPLPVGCSGYLVQITDFEDNTDTFETKNSQFTYFQFSGTLSVKYAFVDMNGQGAWSNLVSGDVADGNVTASRIADGAVTEAKIYAGAVTSGKIAANAVTAAKIQANAVTADKINAGAVTTEKLNASAVTAAKIAADAVTSEKIMAGSIITDKIGANAVTTAKIAANAVTAQQIAANAVTADKISVTQLSAICAVIGLLRTATSGARMEIESNQLRVYDSSGTLRVRLGIW